MWNWNVVYEWNSCTKWKQIGAEQDEKGQAKIYFNFVITFVVYSYLFAETNWSSILCHNLRGVRIGNNKTIWILWQKTKTLSLLPRDYLWLVDELFFLFFRETETNKRKLKEKSNQNVCLSPATKRTSLKCGKSEVEILFKMKKVFILCIISAQHQQEEHL